MEKAILVGLNTENNNDFLEAMEELKNLSKACQIEVLSVLTQNRDKPSIKFYIGKGKVEELKILIDELEPNLVIFDNELSPSQIKNLEKELEIKVIDRTVLILDIFARRARTTEARLQVDLAQSEYMLPRVIGMYQSLSRQKSGTGSKGPGEQKLELDRRLLRNKITRLKRELKDIVEIRRTQRKNRLSSQVPVVALTGYTNSGKSTLMNALIDASTQTNKVHAFKKDMLFATLETKTTQISLNNSKSFLLTDTVGFIKKLPHQLIEAFKSTLEEINEADLLLHVIDVSNDNFDSQIQAVEDVLAEIKADSIPVIYVYNKIDLLKDIPSVKEYNSIFISAEEQTNINDLLVLINQEIEKNTKIVQLLLPYQKGDIYSHIKKSKSILSSSYENEGVLVEVKLSQAEIERYKQYLYIKNESKN